MSRCCLTYVAFYKKEYFPTIKSFQLEFDKFVSDESPIAGKAENGKIGIKRTLPIEAHLASRTQSRYLDNDQETGYEVAKMRGQGVRSIFYALAT